MKTLFHIGGIKIVRGLAGAAAWAVIIAAGMILGAVITAEAAPAVPEFADYHQKDAQDTRVKRFMMESVLSENRDLSSRLEKLPTFRRFKERLLQPNIQLQIKEVPPLKTVNKRRWNFIKLRDVQKNGKTPIVRFEFL